MFVTLRLTLSVTLNLTARESILHIVPAFSDDPRSISLVWRKQVEKLIAGPSRQTQGMRSKLCSINSSSAVSSNLWLDDPCVLGCSELRTK